MTTEVGTLQFKTETRDIVRAEKEIARLEKEVAKIEKSQQRAAAQAVKLSNSKYKVAASAAKASKEFKALGFEFMQVSSNAQKAERKMEDLEAAAMKGRGGFRAMRGSTSQLGMQLQDIAVQAQMGTNGLIILGQQGPQILSLFGPGGAIVGAFVAVGAAAISMADGFSISADQIAEDIKNLERRFDDLTQAQREIIARQTLVQIKELQGDINGLEKRLADAKDPALAAAAALSAAGGGARIAQENVTELQAALDTKRQKLVELEGQLKGYTQSTKTLVQNLAEEVSTFGFSEKAMALRQARLEGLRGVDLLRIAALYDLKEAQEAQAEAEKTAKQEEESRARTLASSIAALELKAATVGMAARMEALYRAEQNGATQAEKDRINAAFDVIDAKTEELKSRKAAIKLENEEGALRAQFAANDIRRLEQQQRERDRETAARDKALQAAYDYAQGIIAMNDTEQEAFDRMITNKRTKLEEDYKAGLILEAEYQAAKTELIEAEANRAAEIEKKIAAERTKALLQMEDVFMSGKSDRAKAAYRLGVNLMNQEKRDNAERIISESYVAAMKAYSALAKINIVGPALGAAAAAAVLATGTAYAAGALSGRALGGQVRPGESYIVGERGPEVLTMGNAGGRIATNESMRGAQPSLVYSPTVNISGGATEQDRALFTAQLRQQKAEIADLLARRRF